MNRQNHIRRSPRRSRSRSPRRSRSRSRSRSPYRSRSRSRSPRRSRSRSPYRNASPFTLGLRRNTSLHRNRNFHRSPSLIRNNEFDNEMNTIAQILIDMNRQPIRPLLNPSNITSSLPQKHMGFKNAEPLKTNLKRKKLQKRK